MIHSSAFWIEHFKQNLKNQRVNWALDPQISADEKEAILYSLKAWQLGETSDGSHLKAAVKKYAKKCGEFDYHKAVGPLA